jgi:cytochrome c oxidase cbb3-type subunit 3
MRQTFILFAAMLLAALALAGCSALPGEPKPGPEVPRPDDVLDFTVLYQQNCSGCHGAAGRGGAAISLADPVFLGIVDEATLRRITANGVPGTSMPAFAHSAGGMLTDRQIDVLVHEMRTRWAKPDALHGATPPPYLASAPGDAQRGADVYKIFCASCHGVDGSGSAHTGSIIDGSYLALISDQGLRVRVIVGEPESGAPDWRNNVPDRPMTSQEVSDVVAWLSGQRVQFPGQPYPAGTKTPAPAMGGAQ